MLRRKILNKAVVVCANSEYTANLVSAIRKNDKPVIIHPCSGEVVDFNEQCAKEDFILSVGRLEERKGFQYAIESFKMVCQKYPKLKYYIAGDGPYKQILQYQIESRDLSDRCILLDRVGEEEKHKLLKNCNLLVMPSFYNERDCSVEGFGIVYIEANAHGKPVIGTYSGGIPDAIVQGKTGLLVAEKNVLQLTDAIDSILSGKIQIDETVCRKWAAEHYYPEIAKQYIRVIKNIVLQKSK